MQSHQPGWINVQKLMPMSLQMKHMKIQFLI